MAGPRQLKGNIKLALAGTGLVDQSGFVTSMVVGTARASITVPAPLSTAQSSTVAGERSQSLTIRFHSGVEATSLWARLYSIITSDDALMDWEGSFEPGAITADNVKFFGNAAAGNAAVLLSLDTGADVGALRQQTITLPLQGPASTAIA
jgi:hypothetical protein